MRPTVVRTALGEFPTDRCTDAQAAELHQVGKRLAEVICAYNDAYRALGFAPEFHDP